MDIHGIKTNKYQLSCCALAQLQASSDASFEELEYQVERAKKESKLRWKPDNRKSGERAFFSIVSPGEDELEEKLIKLKFKHIFTFPRRNGYPPGELKMYALSW